MKTFNFILFFIGLALLAGLYLYFLEVWRAGCFIVAAGAVVYFCAGVAIMEG